MSSKLPMPDEEVTADHKSAVRIADNASSQLTHHSRAGYVGHKDIILKFSTLAKDATLFPVILFYGKEGIGKNRLLKHLASILLCDYRTGCGKCSSCLRAASDCHPDLFAVDQMSEKLKLVDAKSIQEHLSLAAGKDRYRVVIVNDIERFNEQSVNRLLKVVEEPPERCFILMSTSHPRAILDTLLSRCVKWLVKPPSREEFKKTVEDHLRSVGSSEPASDIDFESLERKAGLSPGRALAYLDGGYGAVEDSFIKFFDSSLNLEQFMDHTASLSKEFQLSPRRLLFMLEEHLNTYYRLHLSDQKSLIPFEGVRRRREVLNHLRRVTLLSDAAFNTRLVMDAVAELRN